MSGKSGISGSGYNMNEAMYLKKMEQTCFFESPNLLDDYNRQTLKDIRPDKPFFQSDQNRDNSRFSKDKLSLRHTGDRSEGVNPDLPDGTFLDFDGLTRDKRGTALEPDMKQYRSQQQARGKFIKMFDDSDNSVLSEGIHPTTMMKNIKGQFYNVKNRLKIFDESKGTYNNSGMSQRPLVEIKECLQKTDARSPEMQDQTCYTRSSVVNDLSNNTSIGWKRTTDHIFKVAKYGILRGQAKPNSQNILKNRSNAGITHDIVVAFQDQNTSKSLSIKMIDLAKRKQRDMDSGKEVQFGSSTQNKLRSYKITAKDLSGFAMENTVESQDASANSLLNSEQTSHLTGKHFRPIIDSNIMKKIIIDPFIIEYMASINRKMSPMQFDDLRQSIVQSAENTGFMVNQSNTKRSSKIDVNNELLWQSTANYNKGNSMKVANYKILTGISGAKNQDMFNFEEFKSNDKTSKQRRGNINNPTLYNFDAVRLDNDSGPEHDRVKLIGGIGSKYMNSYHVMDMPENVMGDISVRN